MAHARVLQATVKGKIGTEDYRNVIHFGSDVEVNDATLNAFLLALAAHLMQCFVAHLLPVLAPSIAISGVEVKQIFPSVSDPVEDNTDAGNGGAAGTVGGNVFVSTNRTAGFSSYG